MAARNYSNKATPATLGGGISSSDTSLSLSTVAGLPSSFPFTLVLEPDSTNAEVVSCTGLVGTIATVTRGQDGTTAVAHAASSTVYHDHSARDFQEPQDHIAASTNVHGLSGGSAVAGTSQAQTLTNKTVNLTSNTLSGTTAQFNTALSDNDFATQAGSETLTNKTLTSPTIGGTVPGTTAFTTATASALRAPETTGGAARTAAPYAKISRISSSQSVSSGAVTTILFNNTVTETDATFGDEANNRLVIPVAGYYDFFVQVETDDAGDYGVRLAIEHSTAGTIGMQKGHAQNGVFGAFQAVAIGRNCAAGDTVTATLWHNKGSAINVTIGGSAAGTHLIGRFVGP